MGIRVSFGSKLSIINCDMSNNIGNTDADTATIQNVDGGGGIAGQNCAITIENSRITGNTIKGFAGGGIFFNAVEYDPLVEKGGMITDGQNFEDILKNAKKYNFKKVELTIKGTTIAQNIASGTTCMKETCNNPTDYLACGAGGAIYALGSAKLGLPTIINIDNLTARSNLSAHRNPELQSELVFKNIDVLSIKNDVIVKHANNKYTLVLDTAKSLDIINCNSYKNPALVKEIK